MVNAEEQNSGFIDEVNKLISRNYSKGIIKIRKMFLDNGSYDAAKKLINENIKHANDILKSLPYDTQYLQYFSDLIGARKF
ncbi:MAG: hypothetical protein CMF82_03345 [Candidatus Marinimicrobia bacterium]|nr:hypothetical protein [Candidatus Neomarinimicrobiota bacterium]